MRRRRLLYLGASSIALAGAAACAPNKDTPRPLSVAESERLAVTRFNNFDRWHAPFDLQVAVDDQRLFLTGRVDFRAHLAYSLTTTGDQPPATALIMWTLQKIALLVTRQAQLPTQPPAGRWDVVQLNATRALDTACLLLLNLAADRPENPLLLRQNGAQWVGSTNVDGIPLDQFTGPGPDNRPSDRFTYHVDSTGVLHRVVARIDQSSEPVVINIGRTQADPIESIAQLS